MKLPSPCRDLPSLLTHVVLPSLSLVAFSIARDVPRNVRDFYDTVRSQGSCSRKLVTSFYSSETGTNSFAYCGDHLDTQRVLYIQGRQGALANMDIDCDGRHGGVLDDGRCSASRSPDRQSTTAFRATIAGYDVPGVPDLNPYVHPYVVFGNTGRKPGWPNFDPTAYGIRPLSVMAVVCGDQLVYGVWGDMNGDDGPKPMVGEVSLSLATACGGPRMSGSEGLDEEDVLYLAFVGYDAVPGAEGADWAAGNYAAFEKSIQAIGDQPVACVGSEAYRLVAYWGVVAIVAALASFWAVLG
ncbi:Endo-chitosanase [Madurella fahalii]|uniref:Endo-chitosanase n=1 Tax=Madurella fahalii TaxID=1157608 RepID=A0ABQ0FWH4_9PEZI